jgi:formate--tetrahydrofolate ligase
MSDHTADSPRPISEIATRLGLDVHQWEPCGWFKAKCIMGLERHLADRPQGKYVDVTAVCPTPLGEGKTVTAIGLAMGLERLGHRAIATLREPSLAPVFGIKGGGVGGGAATLLPLADINLHFTGDMHAVAAANNLLAALAENHAQRRLEPLLDPLAITWRRVIDVADKGLSHIISGLDGHPQAPLRETGFDLVAASEVMAVLALATSWEDLQQRLERMIVGWSPSGQPVTAADLRAAGALATLMRDAVRPNLVQTCEHTPAFVHGGPFGNIAHGNSSILADRIALSLADFVITESGFGAESGAEKFFHIKCRTAGLRPNVEVLVCTVRALKYQSGRFVIRPGQPLPETLAREDLPTLQQGLDHLRAHIDILRKFGLPVVVTVNRLASDTDRELELIEHTARDGGASGFAVSSAFQQGGSGAERLAQAVIAACQQPNQLQFLYELAAPLEEKLHVLATQVCGADGVDFEPAAQRELKRLNQLGYAGLPVCVAKTPYSLSHDPRRLGRPRGYRFPIRSLRLAAGAGYVYALAGDVTTMPGLPRDPSARRLAVTPGGQVTGMH